MGGSCRRVTTGVWVFICWVALPEEEAARAVSGLLGAQPCRRNPDGQLRRRTTSTNGCILFCFVVAGCSIPRAQLAVLQKQSQRRGADASFEYLMSSERPHRRPIWAPTRVRTRIMTHSAISGLRRRCDAVAQFRSQMHEAVAGLETVPGAGDGLGRSKGSACLCGGQQLQSSCSRRVGVAAWGAVDRGRGHSSLKTAAKIAEEHAEDESKLE